MTINQDNLNLSHRFRFRVFSQSHRTKPEQLVGLSIYLFIALIFSAFFPLAKGALGLICSLCFSMSMWSLWRSASLTVLKLELSIFLAHFALQTLWYISFWTLGQSLLSLVALLILWCNSLLSILLFWKKQPFSGALLLYPVIWIFYLVGMSMVTCMSIR